MKKRMILSCLLLLTAAGFVFLGVHRGEAGIVLNKAIRICLECVGLK